MRLTRQVVQYILDLNDNRFSDAVIRQFTGNVCALSVQKFSSNVIEKVRSCHVQSSARPLIRVGPKVHPRRRAQHPQDADRRASEPNPPGETVARFLW